MKSEYIKPQVLVIDMGSLQLLNNSNGVSDDGKKATFSDDAPTSSDPWTKHYSELVSLTFLISTSHSPKSIMALNSLIRSALRRSLMVISASLIMPLSRRKARRVPGSSGCRGVSQLLPSKIARLVKEVSVTRLFFTMIISSQSPLWAVKLLSAERSVLL